MFARLALSVFFITSVGATYAPAAVVRQIVRGGDVAPNLLRSDLWRATGDCRRQGDVLVCDNGDDTRAVRGFAQTITLNQTSAKPIIATAFSRATNVGGSRGPDYSLYLDIVYADGTPLWGQSSAFRTGTHDWLKAQVKVFPTKPIRSVTVNLLMRRHSGRAEFKDVRLTQLDVADGMAMFDGQAVIARAPAGGFAIRDVAADSDFLSFENGKALDVECSTETTRAGDAQFVSARITDRSGRDRALTLVYAVPVAQSNELQWLPDARTATALSGSRGEYVVAARTAGGNGLLSRYPFAAVSHGESGTCIGLDMARPAVFRVGYAAGTHELYIAFDIALTKEKPSADLGLCILKFDGRLGFRGAVDAYYRAFPGFFRVRVPRQGIWMPFGKISRVEGWEDFGFMFKEGNDETAWDDAHGILTFRYTEPMTWWMRMPPEMPRTHEAAEAHARALADKGDANARALFTSGMRDEAGKLVGLIRNEPWCDGIVWSMNSAPRIAGEVTDFNNKWNPALRQRLYGADRRGDLDGEYVDSSEGYVTAELDFARQHFAAMNTPLTFSADDCRPAILRGLVAYEYVRRLAEDLHPAGKLTMANSTPHNLPWLAPYLDVMGTETDWKRGGKWQPMSDQDLMYRRILCAGKPYCFLMNTDFRQWTREDTERFMKRCLAYGMFPGFFSANASTDTYFSQPALYNRDRELFRKYVPLCRMVAEAGWRPITAATCSDPEIVVQRFGDRYFTVYNDAAAARMAGITLDGGGDGEATELVSGRPIALRSGTFTIDLAAGDVAVIERN